MSSEIQRQDDDNLVDSDGWSDAAAEANERVIKGTLLKYLDWKWNAGAEGEEVPEGHQLVATSTAAAWVRWEGGKPVEYLMRKLGTREVEREELSHQEAGGWELGPDGVPRDPWVSTRFLYLVDPETAEQYTFSTSSFGGKSAIIGLADQISRMRTARPGAVPVVALGAAPMQTRFGKKSKPTLKVVRWVGGGGEPVPAIESPPMKEITGPTTREELDDLIPF